MKMVCSRTGRAFLVVLALAVSLLAPTSSATADEDLPPGPMRVTGWGIFNTIAYPAAPLYYNQRFAPDPSRSHLWFELADSEKQEYAFENEYSIVANFVTPDGRQISMKPPVASPGWGGPGAVHKFQTLSISELMPGQWTADFDLYLNGEFVKSMDPAFTFTIDPTPAPNVVINGGKSTLKAGTPLTIDWNGFDPIAEFAVDYQEQADYQTGYAERVILYKRPPKKGISTSDNPWPTATTPACAGPGVYFTCLNKDGSFTKSPGPATQETTTIRIPRRAAGKTIDIHLAGCVRNPAGDWDQTKVWTPCTSVRWANFTRIKVIE